MVREDLIVGMYYSEEYQGVVGKLNDDDRFLLTNEVYSLQQAKHELKVLNDIE